MKEFDIWEKEINNLIKLYNKIDDIKTKKLIEKKIKASMIKIGKAIKEFPGTYEGEI